MVEWEDQVALAVQDLQAGHQATQAIQAIDPQQVLNHIKVPTLPIRQVLQQDPESDLVE